MVRESAFKPRPTMELKQIEDEEESTGSKSEHCTEGQSLEDAIVEQLETLSALSMSSSSSSAVKKTIKCSSPVLADEDFNRQRSYDAKRCLIDDRREMSCCTDTVDETQLATSRHSQGETDSSQDTSECTIVPSSSTRRQHTQLRRPDLEKESDRLNAILNTRQISSSLGGKRLDTEPQVASADTKTAKMQRFRRQNDGEANAASHAPGLLPFPSTGSASNLFGLGRKDKGKGKASDDGAGFYALPQSGSTTSLKLPRPRSWVSSLISSSTSSNTLNRLAKPQSPYKRQDSFTETPQQQQQFGGTPPVSSLVLQSGFESERWSEHNDRLQVSALNRSATRSTVGTLHLATMSTPNLPSSSSDEWAERMSAPLLIRNLDDAPRGTVTPQVDVNGVVPPDVPSKAKSARKMTNPWSKHAASSSKDLPTSMRGRLIMADEEELYLNDAVARDRNEGRMANEEQAVLDMLDQMNADVDTFSQPGITRAKSRASNLSRPDLSRSRTSDDADEKVLASNERPRSAVESASKSISFNRSVSPTIKAFASRFEGNGSGSSSSIASSNDRRPPFPRAAGGSVRKAVKEREHLDVDRQTVSSLAPVPDNQSGSLLQAVASTLRKKTSFGAFLSSSTAEESKSRRDMLDEPSPTSTYAGQTSSFLERRPTHKANRYLFRSPNQESQISSDGYATSSSLWSRSEHALDSPGSMPTSPGAASEWDDKRPGLFETLTDGKQAIPPLLRRLRTDATQATTMTYLSEEGSDDVAKVQGLASTVTGGLMAEEVDDEKDDKSSSVGSSISKASSNVSRQSKVSSAMATLPMHDETIRLSTSPVRKRPLTPETGVSPNVLGTPKRAKDLINFFEQSSAPSSPVLKSNNKVKPAVKQLSPLKGESPAQAASRFRLALGNSTLSNAQATTNEAVSEDVDLSLVAEKIGAIGRTHRRRGDRVSAAATVGGAVEFRNPFSSSDGPTDYLSSDDAEDEENVSPVDAMHATIRTGRGPSLFGSKTSAPSSTKANSKNEAVDAATDTRRNSSSAGLSRSNDTTPKGKAFRSSMKSFMNALSNGVNITGGDMGGGGGSDQRRNSGQQFGGAHTTAKPPPQSYRDPLQHPRIRRKMSAEDDADEAQSNLSTRTVGTSASFRQKTEHGKNLRVDPDATLALMGQPDVEPYRTGMVYYFNVHVEDPVWQRAQAVLLPSAVALSWIPVGGGRVSVVLDLHACREVHSVPGPTHPSSVEDFGAGVAKRQGLNRISPFQLIFDDGVERLAVDTTRDRLLWVNAVWDALGERPSRNAAARSRNVSSTLAGNPDAYTDIAEVHMTTPKPTSALWTNVPARFTDHDNGGRRLVPSGLVAVPLEDSKEDVNVLIDDTSPDRDRYDAIAAIVEPAPPAPPPKERSPRRRRFFDDAAPDDSATKAKNDSQETFHSASQPDQDFGPLSPRSEAVLNWTEGEIAEQELVPADSASQRPSRSLTGTILSHFTALTGYRADKTDTIAEERRGSDNASTPTKSSAETVRDEYIDEKMTKGESASRALDTVVEETRSQATTAKKEKSVLASRAVSNLSTQTIPESVSSQDVARLLGLLEQQNEERARRDREMEDQFRAFQQTLQDMQRQPPLTRRRSNSSDATLSVRGVGRSGTINAQGKAKAAAAAAEVATEAAGIAMMQDKLDRVLSLVGDVFDGQSRLESVASEATPRGPQPPTFAAPSELSKIERTLGSLVEQMQSSMPSALRADNRSLDAKGRTLDGRDRAILADRLVHGSQHRSKRRVSAPATPVFDRHNEHDDDAFMTPIADNDGHTSMFASSDVADLEATELSRDDKIPARSWTSSRRAPGAPCNSARDAYGSDFSRDTRRTGPVELNARNLSAFDPLAPGDSMSNVSIDMQAEVRRRRQASQSRRRKAEGRTSQSVQAPAAEDTFSRSLNPDVALLLNAIKDNEEARKAQRQQQQDIARYLNELNSWLERDVVDRSKEWRTLALGVTQLHDELNALKYNAQCLPLRSIAAGGDMTEAMDAAATRGAWSMPFADPAGPQITHLGDAPLSSDPRANVVRGILGPRQQAVDSNDGSTLGNVHDVRMPLTSDALAQLGADAPAPLNVPRPGSPVRRTGTRTWRAQAAPASMRNDDVWQSSGTLRDRKKEKEAKKAEARARRRRSFGKLAAIAGGAALVAAATHEWDKHKERQRQQGKPEVASAQPDATTGTFVTHDKVPDAQAKQLAQAAQSGDETEIRKAIREAAEIGAGAPAIQSLVEQLRKVSEDDAATLTMGNSQDSSTRRSKASTDSTFTAGETDLRRAVENLDLGGGGGAAALGGGGGAMALAVEEILKHLLEKKEDERRQREALSEAEKVREEEKRLQEAEREERMSTLRDQERSELVDTIFAKLQAEKEQRDLLEAQKQREMDPKTAIETLVNAINVQRQADATSRATADATVRQLAEDMVRTSSEQNGKLVEAVHAAAREMLRNNVEAHADDLKRLLSREVNVMFEDVGKIREAKRALELEIADLFQIKSKHLAGIENLKTIASHSPIAAPVAAPAPAPQIIPMPYPMPGGMGMMPMGGGGMFGGGFGAMPDIPAASMSMPKGSAVPPAIPPAPVGGGGMKKRDMLSPFSINFGSR